MQLARLLSHPVAYRLWQQPQARAKLAPLPRHNELAAVRSVLDVGCGPATNAARFSHADYTGLDLDARYIAYARAHHVGRFICADACTFGFEDGPRYEMVLLNSLLHHLDDGRALALLGTLRAAVAPGGHIHVIDLVLPARRSVARSLALLDRGRFPRPAEDWQRLLTRFYRPAVLEPFTVGLPGLPLWHLLYFKGEPV